METLLPERTKKGIDKFKRNIKELKLSDIRNYILENQISVMVLFILGLAFFFRLWQIGSVPGGVSEAENEIINKISALKSNNMWLGAEYSNALYIYFGYIWTNIFGLTAINLRILSALIGGSTVVLSYLFISKWFSKKIAIFMALLLSTSSFHVTVSRLIIPEIMLPFILLALFVSLTYAYRNKSVWVFGLSGVLAGLGFYTSQAFIITIIIFAISGAYFINKNKKFLTSYGNEIFISVAGFISVIIPYMVSFIGNMELYFRDWRFADTFNNVAINFSEVLKILFIGFSSDFFINVGTEPLLDPLIFITSVFGFFYAVFAVSRRKYFFLIAWLLFFYIYTATKPNISTLDLLGLLPAVYTLSALILDYIIDHWFETFPLNKRAKLFAIGLISVFFAISVLYNFNKYFIAYKNSEQVKKEFSIEPVIPLRGENTDG